MRGTTIETADCAGELSVNQLRKKQMSNNIPAFPDEYQDGMTLRDYFAAKAMNGIMMYSVEWYPTGKPADQISLNIFEDMARDSYAIADAMLKAREQ